MSSELPLATVARIAKEGTGADRIGETAAKLISKEATNYIKSLATEAGKLASHAGRSTIREDDVKFILDSWN